MDEAGFVSVREVAGLLGMKPSLLSLRICRDSEIREACVVEKGRRLIPLTLLPDLAERFAPAQSMEVANGQN